MTKYQRFSNSNQSNFYSIFHHTPDCGIRDAHQTEHCVIFMHMPFSLEKNNNTEISYTDVFFIYSENARQNYLKNFSVKMKMPNLQNNYDDQNEMLSESIQESIELCSSVKPFKMRKGKAPWLHNEVKVDIKKKRQTLKRFRGIKAALNRRNLLKNSQKTSFTGKEAQSSHFLNVYSNCVTSPKKVFKMFDEMAGERSVETDYNF